MRSNSGGLIQFVLSFARNVGVRAGFACWVPLFALLGWAASDMPALLHGARTSWIWSGLSMLVCVAAERMTTRWPVRHCSRLAMLSCMAAIGLGMTLDFLMVPPEAVVDLCSGRPPSGFWNGIAFSAYEHLRWFPVTLLAMFALVAVEHVCAWRCDRPGQAMATLRAGCLIALEFGAMLAAMAFSMAALRSLALEFRWPWTANAMASVMLVSMLACLLLRAWSSVAATAALTAVGRKRESGELLARTSI